MNRVAPPDALAASWVKQRAIGSKPTYAIKGRQGKSAAFGRAHVVGFVGYFWQFHGWSRWRFGDIILKIQGRDRHLLSLDGLAAS